MVLFVVLALMTVAALALLVLPLVRRPGAAAPRANYDLEVYRDQLDELERDVERGLIGTGEQATARTEIERRMLAAASLEGAAAPSARTGRSGIIAAFAITILLPLAAGSVYLGLGSPGVEDRPFVAREPGGEPPPQNGGDADVEAMVARLAERLKSQPNDLEGWIMLGRSYGVLGRYDKAVVALEHAERLSGGDADVSAMLTEQRVFAAGGIVSPASVAAFKAVLATNPKQPAARFYLALAHAQAGEYRAALDGWVALARDSPADAPWMPTLREQIAEVSGVLGVAAPVDLESEATAAPGPSADDVAAAAAMSEDEQATMIRGMVGRLAARLEDEPDDLEGWRRLGRSYGVLGEDELAKEAYAHAAALAPDDPAVLAEYAGAIVKAAPEGAPVPEEAVAAFRRLDAIDPDNPAALWHLGLASAQAGDAADARAFWGRLLALLPPGSTDHATVQRALDSLEETAAGG